MREDYNLWIDIDWGNIKWKCIVIRGITISYCHFLKLHELYDITFWIPRFSRGMDCSVSFCWSSMSLECWWIIHRSWKWREGYFGCFYSHRNKPHVWGTLQVRCNLLCLQECKDQPQLWLAFRVLIPMSKKAVTHYTLNRTWAAGTSLYRYRWMPSGVQPQCPTNSRYREFGRRCSGCSQECNDILSHQEPYMCSDNVLDHREETTLSDKSLPILDKQTHWHVISNKTIHEYVTLLLRW